MKEDIEKAAVLKVLEEYYPGADERLHIVKDITSIPTDDVAEVRHGKWEYASYNGVYDVLCSACGYSPGLKFYTSNYCPNCGALMLEDEHEAD